MYQIVTDSCCDLPYQVLANANVDFLSMEIQIGEEIRIDDLGKTFDYEGYIQQLHVKEQCLRPHKSMWVAIWSSSVAMWEKGIPVLYVAFSSGMSGSYSSALQAVELLKETYEDPQVHVFDTKAASIGEGLLVLEAVRLKESGYSLKKHWLGYKIITSKFILG